MASNKRRGPRHTGPDAAIAAPGTNGNGSDPAGRARGRRPR